MTIRELCACSLCRVMAYSCNPYGEPYCSCKLTDLPVVLEELFEQAGPHHEDELCEDELMRAQRQAEFESADSQKDSQSKRLAEPRPRLTKGILVRRMRRIATFTSRFATPVPRACLEPREYLERASRVPRAPQLRFHPHRSLYRCFGLSPPTSSPRLPANPADSLQPGDDAGVSLQMIVDRIETHAAS